MFPAVDCEDGKMLYNTRVWEKGPNLSLIEKRRRPYSASVPAASRPSKGARPGTAPTKGRSSKPKASKARDQAKGQDQGQHQQKGGAASQKPAKQKDQAQRLLYEKNRRSQNTLTTGEATMKVASTMISDVSMVRCFVTRTHAILFGVLEQSPTYKA